MIGLWISTGLLLMTAMTALIAPGRPRWLGEAAHQISWIVNELPQVGIGWLVASFGLALAQGDLGWRSTEDAAMVTVGMMTAITLLWLWVRARTAPQVFTDALRSELGDEVTVAPVSRWRALLPVPRRHRSVRHVRNVSYGPYGRRNRLDVYVGRDSTPVGMFVHFHGGHFRIGRKDTQSLPLLHHLARHGWVCVSANYRLQPKAEFPDYVVDAKRAIAWAREHAVEHGVDPSMVVAGGDSAGAYLALFSALTFDQPRHQPGFEGSDTSLAGVVALYGYYGRTTPAPQSTPLAHLRADTPPIMVVHGTHDTSVPIDWVRPGVDEMRRISRSPVVQVELPGAQHTFDYFHSVRSDALANATLSFLKWIVARSRQSDADATDRDRMVR